MPVGNEGAGVVVAAGDPPEAQALLGRTVAIVGGPMYAQYRTIQAAGCLVLSDGATAMEGASCFVNPLTSLVDEILHKSPTGLQVRLRERCLGRAGACAGYFRPSPQTPRHS